MGLLTATSLVVDARGARVGAAVSVFLLVIAGDLRRSGSPERAVVLVFAIALAMAVSAATSLRWNALSLPFRLARANGAIGAPSPDDLQPVIGLRLAQAIGAGCLVAAGVAWAASADVLAVGLIALLASLQVLLAITGICVACRFYGVIVWLERRRAPSALPPMATQKIQIQR